MQTEDNRLFDRLLAAYISNEITLEDKERLFGMIMGSDVYKRQYEEAARLNTFIRLPVFESHKQEDYILLKDRVNHGEPLKWIRLNRYGHLGRAAVVVLLFLITSFGSVFVYERLLNGKETTGWVEASTPIGGQAKLLLPDGSIVWLNAKSELKYSPQFGISERKLFLSGEAFFQVGKNERLPVSVQSGDMEIVATGTMFNVRSYADDGQSEVQLLEGGIDVTIADRTYSLVPDEKILYDKALASATIGPADASSAIAWTKGKLSFYQASIPDIYKMLERHFDVRIRIESQDLRDEYFFGSINLDMSLSEILNYLDVDKKYRIELEDDVIVVRDK